jgi:hypothetical protein
MARQMPVRVADVDRVSGMKKWGLARLVDVFDDRRAPKRCPQLEAGGGPAAPVPKLPEEIPPSAESPNEGKDDEGTRAGTVRSRSRDSQEVSAPMDPAVDGAADAVVAPARANQEQTAGATLPLATDGREASGRCGRLISVRYPEDHPRCKSARSTCD